ncbi:DNA processing protein [Amaricoccus macauensis]|uniref:DNA processing protein n=1 Tax=Amaricoccus macauensis TaxID=57001 RepID=A0A840SLX9_9RHOB|nr:DNA-processing protein DprA [Amaricoccus macauensis]MBB5221615.1 DNA processing protein [Amaricoccus macauensis]
MTPPTSTKVPPDALPASPAAQLDWLRLARSRRVGPVTFIRLLRETGSAAAALERLPGLAAAAGVRDYRAAARTDAEAEIATGMAAGARLLLLGSADYPAALALVDDAPPVLWALGDTSLGRRPTVALVGARNASALGRRMASQLARDLGAAGFVVASGLARGIDAAAHRAALDSGTIAAQAGGIDVVYPSENADLAAEMAIRGLRLSEMPPGHAPRAQDFPRRNRIISGLALGVVVIEGALRSGSLITARNAADQGREVMAVPGNPLDARAGGCNALIRDGATLVRDAADVMEALGATLAPGRQRPPPSRPAIPDPPPATGDDLGNRLLELLTQAPVAEDLLIRETGQTAAAVSAALIELELVGRLQRHPGGFVSLA